MIQNDFTIYPKTKVIRHTSGITVYSAVAFYSYLMTTFDEPGYLTYETPIRFNTPTSFTMLNGWFLDNGDGSNILQYLTGGGIDTSGYATVTDKVYMVDLTSVTDFDDSPTDKDLMVKSGANVGPLLTYKNNYPSAGLARIWVRDTQTHGAIAGTTVTEVTTAGGTGTGTSVGGGSVNGDEIYHNLFTIASFPTDVNPQVYIYQNHPVTGARVRIAEWSAFSNWDRGSIDILIPVQLGGSLIDSGNIKSFVRQTGDTFTFVESTLAEAGRTPIATETSADEVNVTKGEYYLLYDTSDTGSFTIDDVIQDTSTASGTPPTWYAEVTAVTEFTDTTTGVLTLRGLRGTILTTNPIYVGTVQEALANGVPGDTYLSWTSGTAPSTPGQVLTGGTSGAKRLQRGVDATAKKIVAQDNPTGVTGTNRDAYYKDFSNGETVTGATTGSVVLNAASTTIISGYNDITIAHMNGTVVTGASYTGTFIIGEKITYNAGADSAILIYANSLTAPTIMMLGNVGTTEPDAEDTFTGQLSSATCAVDSGLTDENEQNFNFTLQSYADPYGMYSVFIEGGAIYNTGRSLSDIYAYLQYYLRDGQDASSRVIYTSTGAAITQVAAEEYIKAVAAYSATKPAPFGTLAGVTFFGAQGVWLTGMAAADNNNIKLTDTGGDLRYPFTSVDLVISNTRVGDRIAVYLENGTTTLPKKDQYTSHATTNDISDSTFDAPDGVTFPNDTPTSGTFIVVDTSASEEHRYRYDSFNNTGGTGDDGQLILPAEWPGTTDGSTSGQVFEDSSEDFTTGGTAAVQIGDIIRRTTGGKWCYVTGVTNAASGILATTLMNDGTGWETAQAYEINSLVANYDGNDKFFIPYMDFRETADGSQTVTVTYVADREVVIEARNVENATQIVPFKTTGTINSTGLSQSVIRTEDTVYA